MPTSERFNREMMNLTPRELGDALALYLCNLPKARRPEAARRLLAAIEGAVPGSGFKVLTIDQLLDLPEKPPRLVPVAEFMRTDLGGDALGGSS